MKNITVKELIAELKTCDPDDEIYFINENEDDIDYIGIGSKYGALTIAFNCESAYEK